MAYIPYQFPLSGGWDRSKVPCRADLSTFWRMDNWRQSNTQRGALEPTPRFYLSGTIPQKTYWNGSTSVLEPTASSVIFKCNESPLGFGIALTSYCGTYSGSYTQMWSIIQTAVPTASAVVAPIKGCLLVLVSTALATITLGNRYDVVIDGTNTFKWRVNGGSYTTGVVIDQTNGNLIDSNGARVYWQASTGFTAADTWSWTRTDGLSAVNQSYLSPIRMTWLSGGGYFMADVLMKVEMTSNNVPYMRSVGYRYLLGNAVGYHEGHLLVFGTNSTYNSNSGSYLLTSDILDLDVFIPTDLNEADQFNLPLSTTESISKLEVIDGFTLQTRLYVVTNIGLFYSDYAGLPTPYTFRQLFPEYFARQPWACTPTRKGAYIWRTDALFFFDGLNLSLLVNLNSLGTTTPLIGVWQSDTEELHLLMVNNTLLVYQARYGTFYSRSVDFGATGCTCLTISLTGNMFLGTASRKVIAPDSLYGNVPIYDYGLGSSFFPAVVATQLIGNIARLSKDMNGVYIAVYVPGVVSHSANYSDGDYTELDLFWYTSDSGNLPPSSSPTTISGAVWNPTKPDGQISYPRLSYRYIGFALQHVGLDGSKPPGPCTLQAIECEVYSPDKVTR